MRFCSVLRMNLHPFQQRDTLHFAPRKWERGEERPTVMTLTLTVDGLLPQGKLPCNGWLWSSLRDAELACLILDDRTLNHWVCPHYMYTASLEF